MFLLPFSNLFQPRVGYKLRILSPVSLHFPVISFCLVLTYLSLPQVSLLKDDSVVYVCVCVDVCVCVCVFMYIYMYMAGFPCSSVGKEPACNAGDLGSIPGSGRSLGEGNGNPLQYSCLENPIDRSLAGYSPWCCKSWTRFSD